MGLRILLYIALGYVLWRVYRDVLDRISPRPPTSPGARDNPDDSLAPDWASEVLGVAPATPLPEVKAAYQSLGQQYHPDRVNGLGEELQEIADRRTKEINEAYQEFKKRQ